MPPVRRKAPVGKGGAGAFAVTSRTAGGTSGKLMDNGDPAMSSSFLLEVDGYEIGIFREVSGLSFEVDVVPHSEGGQNGFIHQLPGRMKYPNIVFKRGLTQSDALFDWANRTSGAGFAGAKNKLARSTGAVTALDYEGFRLRSWEFIDAYPVKWSGPQFSTPGVGERGTPLEETLEIVHHGFTSVSYDR